MTIDNVYEPKEISMKKARFEWGEGLIDLASVRQYRI